MQTQGAARLHPEETRRAEDRGSGCLMTVEGPCSEPSVLEAALLASLPSLLVA